MAQSPRRRITAAPAPRRRKMASPDEYNAFIQQVELRAVWLAATNVANHIGAEAPDRAEVAITRDSRWEPADGGFHAFDTYEVILGPTGEPAALISVTFGLAYESNLPMSDGLFIPFREFNLSLNAWPYAREFVANTTARMNWVPFTLPALKLGAISDADN